MRSWQPGLPFRCSVFLFETLKESSSPYINRFLSADTIVPGFTNPQNLNRYSYVTNNPLRYTDPTGHMMVEDEGSTRGGLDCRKFPQYCTDGKKKSDEELLDMRPKPDDPEPEDATVTSQTQSSVESKSSNCPYGWISAMVTPDGSCGHVIVNVNAIIDPLAWTHMAEGYLGGLVLFGVGDLLIKAGARVCTSVIGCFAGAPVVVAGVLAYPVGVGFIYYGVKSTEIYLDDIFEVEH